MEDIQFFLLATFHEPCYIEVEGVLENISDQECLSHSSASIYSDELAAIACDVFLKQQSLMLPSYQFLHSL